MQVQQSDEDVSTNQKAKQTAQTLYEAGTVAVGKAVSDLVHTRAAEAAAAVDLREAEQLVKDRNTDVAAAQSQSTKVSTSGGNAIL